jgi:hypothetical protein
MVTLLLILLICAIKLSNAWLFYAEDLASPLDCTLAIGLFFFGARYSKENGVNETLKLFFKLAVLWRLTYIFIDAVNFTFEYYISVPLVFSLVCLFVVLRDYAVIYFYIIKYKKRLKSKKTNHLKAKSHKSTAG